MVGGPRWRTGRAAAGHRWAGPAGGRAAGRRRPLLGAGGSRPRHRARTLAQALTHHPARLGAAQARALPHLLRDGARCPDHASDPGWLLDGFALAAHLEHATRQQAPGRTPEPAGRADAPPGTHRRPTTRATRAEEHAHAR
jgi:hypothetical protein